MNRSSEIVDPPFIVAIGASAGGLAAITSLVDNLPGDTGATFVLVQHLSPDFKSLMPSLLAKHTSMNIELCTQGVVTEPDTIYLIPPGKEMTLEGRTLNLESRAVTQMPHLPINIFFESVAKHAQSRVVAVVLSGTGSDGTEGIKVVKEAGGFVLVQEPGTAEYDGMPINAISTGVADVVAPPDELGMRLTDFLREPSKSIRKELLKSNRLRARDEDPLSDIFFALQEFSGVDFSLYKTATVHRRIERRINATQAQTIEAYRSFCIQSPTEIPELFSELMINVTGFFRDPDAWELLNRMVIEPLVQNYKPGNPVRVWSAGCSSGEEAYSIAMLFEEAKTRFEQNDFRYKIFATDADIKLMEGTGKLGYSEAQCSDLNHERKNRFFRFEDGRYFPKMHLRDRLVFVTHNILTDPPFTRIDLVTCRNMLIYFGAEAQDRALSALHFAVRSKGALWLGPSESLSIAAQDFSPLDNRWKIYRKSTDRKIPLLIEKNIGGALGRYTRTSRRPVAENLDLVSFYGLIAKEYVFGCYILDEQYNIIQMLGHATRWVTFSEGEPSFNILKMTTGNLRLAVSALLHRLKGSGEPVDFSSVEIIENGVPSRVTLKGRLLESGEGNKPSFVILVEESRQAPELEQGTASSAGFESGVEVRQHAIHLERELNATRENLHATIEELETTNEELQSTNEELMASNEELQSSNEKLHAVNEELYTVNAEHQSKISQLTDLSNDMENILGSSAVATLFVDRHLRIRKFTPEVQTVLNVLSTDIGRRLTDLTHSLEGLNLHELVVRVMANSEVETTEVAGGEAWYTIHASPYRTESGTVQGAVVNFTDITKRRDAEAKLRELTEQLRVQALHDYLTGLLNRRGIATALSREVSNMERAGTSLCAVLIDCDEFKNINDRLGHSTGDVVLKEISKRLSETLRPSDHVGRLGGDEFLVLAPGVREAEARQLAERLRLAVSGAPFYAPEPMHLTASLGVASIPRGQNSLEEVISRTQGLLKASKEGGRNQISFVDAGEIASVSGFPTHNLVSGGGLTLMTQTLVDTKTGETVGHELLSRGPEGPLKMPDQLFRACMDQRILTQVDTRCLERALEWTKGQTQRAHINLFPSTLLDLSPERIAMLFDTPSLKGRVCIELSEQQFLGDPVYLREHIQELRKYGVEIALDDVGFGRSSLESLIVLEPEIVKIDKCYVMDCHKSVQTRRALSRLVSVLRSVDSKIIAEGVETEQDRSVVVDLGIQCAQGYLWNRPTPATVNVVAAEKLS